MIHCIEFLSIPFNYEIPFFTEKVSGKPWVMSQNVAFKGKENGKNNNEGFDKLCTHDITDSCVCTGSNTSG